MLLLEIIITILFYLFLPFYFVERVIHKKSHGWKEKFAYVKEFTKEDKVIHIHCCSVGEALAIENLLKSIRANFPENKIVVTTLHTLASRLHRKNMRNWQIILLTSLLICRFR